MAVKKRDSSYISELDAKDLDSGSFSVAALDNAFKANMAHITGGISPAGLLSLYFTWASHLAMSPGKQVRLVEKMLRKTIKMYRLSPGLLQKKKVSPVLLHCRKISVFHMQVGSSGRITIFIRIFYSLSNGGTMRQQILTVYLRRMREVFHLLLGRF